MPLSALSRRRFLAATSAAALSPMLVRRVGAQAAPGALVLAPVTGNPAGAAERVFVLRGNPLEAPVTAILAEDGAPVPAPVLEPGTRRVLRLFHFNDMHNKMTEQHAARGDTHRLAQMVKRVRAARAAAGEGEIVLFLSAGDDHTGSIYDELLGWAPSEFVADAGYRAASAAGVDAAAFGNHEIDRGAEMLALGIARDAAFPVLSANVTGSRHIAMGQDYVAGAVIEAKGLRIGLMGLTTQVDTRVGLPDDPGMTVASPVLAVRNLLPALAEISDVVVILSHCGYGTGQHATGKAGAPRLIGEGDFDIAAAAGPLTDKPVVLIGGHSHTRLNAEGIDPDNVIEGVLMAQAEANGRFLGEVAMSLAAEGGRRAWFTHVGLHPVKPRDKRVAADDPRYPTLEQDGDYDAAFEEAVMAPLTAALAARMAEPIGTVATGDTATTEATLRDRYMGECVLANFMNDALVARSATFPNGPVDLALFNATAIQAGVQDGPLTFKAWYDVMPYADLVHVAQLTGAQIRDILANNAVRIVRADESGIDMTGFVSRGFLHFSAGIRYRILPGASAAETRIADVTILGAPVETVLERSFSMAINSYIQLGAFGEAWNGSPIGAGVPGEIASLDLRRLEYKHTGLVYRNEIIAHIRAVGGLSPETGARRDGRLIVG